MFLFGLVVGLVAGSPHASADSDDDAQAREEFREGVAAAKKGQREKAIAHYRRSIDFKPHPRTYFNLGVIYEELGRLAEAIDAYKNFRRTASKEDKETSAIDEKIADLEDRASVVVDISSDPEGADVFLPDKDTPLGRTPFRVRLVPGTYELRFKHRDKGDTRETIKVETGGQTFRVTLEGPKATLLLRANLPDSTVVVDKQVRGPASTGKFEVLPGERTVIVRAAGYQDARRTMKFDARTVTELDVELSPERTTTEWLILGALGTVTVLASGTAAGFGIKAKLDDDEGLANVADVIGGTSAAFGAATVIYYLVTRHGDSTVNIQRQNN